MNFILEHLTHDNYGNVSFFLFFFFSSKWEGGISGNPNLKLLRVWNAFFSNSTWDPCVKVGLTSGGC